MKKRKVAVLGATGVVGQVFLWLLSDHVWFEPACIVAKESRRGSRYRDAVRWQLPFPMPDRIKNLELKGLDLAVLEDSGARIVFSALPAEVAGSVEPRLREGGFYVFSNAGAMRFEPDVPILIPEANPDSLDQIRRQGFPERGFIVTNANCSVTGLAAALAPLRGYRIKEVFVSTYQAVSGAGYPGLPSLDIIGNVIPFIDGEEGKIKSEILKILNLDAEIYPHCARVPVPVGHLETVWVKFEQPVKEKDIINTWLSFRAEDRVIPSMPENPIVYLDREDFPQPRMSFFGDPPGMPVLTGRVKRENDRIGFILLVNNLVKGAAGGSIQNAESFVCRYGDQLE